MVPTRGCPLRFFPSIAITVGAAIASLHAATCCVWRVTNLPQPFYLVGTMHALTDSDYPLPKGYDQALRDSKRLVFEMRPDPLTDDEFDRLLVSAAIYPKGDSIVRHVHPKTWAILKANYGPANVFGKEWWIGEYHIGDITRLRPWGVAFMLWRGRGFNDVFASLGVDNHLGFEARRLGKETAGLETPREHVEVLGGLTDIESELMLLETIQDTPRERSDYDKDRIAWKHGNVAALWADHQRERHLNVGAEIRLLDMRNVRWVPKIKAEMKSGKPTSIVVGALHMLGPNGLIALLQRNGYKFQQL
jgi:uncharacterized protein YbaP (TraB family)